MAKVLTFAAAGEALTGAALLIAPSVVTELLLGAQLSGAGIAAARVAGIALIGLGLACSPGSPPVGMLAYSAGVTVYLACLGVVGAHDGVLLWPVVSLHGVLSFLLCRAWLGGSSDPTHTAGIHGDHS